MTLGDRIHDVRIQRRLSLRELASRSGVSHSQLSAIEHSRTGTTVDALRRIAQALDVPLVALTGDATAQGTTTETGSLYLTPPEEGQHPHSMMTPSTLPSPSPLPPGLAELRDDPLVGPELDDEWLRLLAGLTLHGRRPRTKRAWLSAYVVMRLLFEAEAE